MIKKILLLGSGALKIGQAGEFDYSGSQAIKAFREEGIKTILVNPNIATIQTSKAMADKVYFLPINPEFIEQVIIKENPDAIALSFGGQTALNCGMDLYKKGVFKKYHVQVLGTPVSAIVTSEDRQLFADHLKKINVSTPASHAVNSTKEGLKIARKLKLPVMIRAGFALGGQKSGVAHTEKEFMTIAEAALAFSPQILVEKYLHHYKEIEYEVVRDNFDNCVTVCNMENFDPLGIHTGESIVVAPSQTLTNYEYHFLRQKSIEIVRSLGIVGECNVQFALNPHPESTGPISGSFPSTPAIDYYVIEVNARLSRSSALASKATGYPLAYVAAKLILGKPLTRIINQITRVTQAAFEPALDYLVVKIPRWDIEKFRGAEEVIGSSMKSVGEVMAIGRTFEEAIQKATRMLDIGVHGVIENRFANEKEIWHYIKSATPRRLFAITAGIKKGFSIDKIYQETGVDKWFLYRLKNIVDAEKEMVSSVGNGRDRSLQRDQLLNLKRLGFSDRRIGEALGKTELEVRSFRIKNKITPSVFAIDTLAGEFPAKTNYLYTTYWGSHHDVKPIGQGGIMVLGSGPYRIGSSVEFDWSSVNVAQNLKRYKKQSIVVNCNPETVSTDYDMSDRLYFEELTFERVSDIYEFEKASSIILSVGGQTPNNLSTRLNNYGVKILGTKAGNIDLAENRNKFSDLLDRLGILQPLWKNFTDMGSALKFAKEVGYPVLIRPSYVLSGLAMNLCYDEAELKSFVKRAVEINKKHPVTISKYMTNAREVELDGVAQGGKLKVYALSNHVEHAGVHSGDATIVYPAERVRYYSGVKMVEIAQNLTKALSINGPFNIQYMVKDNKVYVIELNLRASRTFPFISKVTGVNFAAVTVDAFFGKAKEYQIDYPAYVAVKAPQFSFARLEGADPVLRVEMSSTGEVACFGDTAEEAYLKSLISTGLSLDKKSALVTIGGEENKLRFAESIWKLKNLGFELYATNHTHKFLNSKGVRTKLVSKVYERRRPNVIDIIEQKKVSLVINLSEKGDGNPVASEFKTDGYLIRRAAIDHNISLFTDLNSSRLFVNALEKYRIKDLKIKSWEEYLE
ncbi:carbamoyl-phosphate synthase (glutamine-hydrolyzing) large subunit [Patescibacteria group bacterium]|nr:carbamoyl-phosphate synthase (glutamine-hydrolyzing) large subunit [Patescibacteria group bacterium]